MILQDVFQTVGNTPMLQFCSEPANIFLKLECFNPTGSVKDRIALSMLLAAEACGKLRAGGTVVEPTSGNTGISLAALSAARGYRCILVMPETMSEERKKLLRLYGAQVVLTPGGEGMRGAVRRAQEIAAKTGAFLPMQFENPANPAAHYKTTAPEILSAVKRVDALICGVGTGGTLTGIAQYLKKRGTPRVFAVEPASSPVLSGGKAGAHGIQGIGAGFVPAVLDRSLIDEVIPVRDEDALSAARALAGSRGLGVGLSSGAALWAAEQIASRRQFLGKNLVAVLPDSADRYLSVL